MKNKIGSIVAIDPANGEILAMVSSPGFDPNLLVGRQRGQHFDSLMKAPNKPLFNRAVGAAYPPGSIFKMVQALLPSIRVLLQLIHLSPAITVLWVATTTRPIPT